MLQCCPSCYPENLQCWVQLGGIGFVHYNMPLEQQVQTVQKVKQQAVGFVANPVVLSREMLAGTNQEKQVCSA